MPFCSLFYSKEPQIPDSINKCTETLIQNIFIKNQLCVIENTAVGGTQFLLSRSLHFSGGRHSNKKLTPLKKNEEEEKVNNRSLESFYLFIYVFIHSLKLIQSLDSSFWLN